jgi:hypothetical protein
MSLFVQKGMMRLVRWNGMLRSFGSCMLCVKVELL